ncbi:hypothetical protein F4778DRAFT_732119 [Xylariomycetidae sp. FL2044]|nr:hypothetical protein F4778DRAFT_732119 [Xylariomycetidae sp. FL2044]
MSRSTATPSFGSAVIQAGRTDGYWVETFHFSQEDKVPGVMTSGLVSGLIEFLDNPIAEHDHKVKTCRFSCSRCKDEKPSIEKPWTKYEIKKYDSPVSIVAVDITGNGLMDLVVCHDYGPFMLESYPQGGHITWLENPGRDNLKDGSHWKERYIGRWPAMHRIKAGHFTQRSFLEIVAASVVYGPHNKTTPIPIICFRSPEKVLEAVEWSREIIDDQNYTCIHEVIPRKLDGPKGLESLIISSREGSSILSYDEKKKYWVKDLVSIGEPKEPRQTPDSESPGSGDHWGTGCADIGRVGNDPYAYIATLDPFHGIAACVFTKASQSLNGKPEWKRHVLDVYGTPNQRMKTGDGPGHFIICADFDGDGDDEFLLSLYGPLDRDEDGESIPPPSGPHPFKGIMYYKAIDLDNGIFAKWRVAKESSARIAVGNFAGVGRLDLVSIEYNVKRYYEEPDPVVTIHLNNIPSAKGAEVSSPAIRSTLWDSEGMVYLLNPSVEKNKVTTPSIAQLIEIAGYSLSVEVYPPGYKIAVSEGDGLKTLFGSVLLFKEDGSLAGIRQPFSVPKFTAATTTTSYKKASADPKLGAVLLRLRPLGQPTRSFSERGAMTMSNYTSGFPAAKDVPLKTTLSLPPPLPSQLTPLTFNKVDTLWWGAPFKDVDFYNLSGFHFQFLSPESRTSTTGSSSSSSSSSAHDPLAHIQFWTAARDVNCGVHNHASDAFCEIHVALSAGTGNGGMARLKPEFAARYPPGEYNELGREAFDWLLLRELEEHGGMWERESNGRPVRKGITGVVEYPFHKWHGGTKAENVDVWMAIEFATDAVDRAAQQGEKMAKVAAGLQERTFRRGGEPVMGEWDDREEEDVVMV